MLIHHLHTDAAKPHRPGHRTRLVDRVLDAAMAASVPAVILIALLTLLLTGCGGSGDEASPAVEGNAALTAEQIASAQGAIERTSSSVDASRSALDAPQIDAQRSALDGRTTDGTATIDANQQALDGDQEVAPSF